MMKLYSTNNAEYKVDLKTAVLQSLAPDKGLYMPVTIPNLPASFFENLPSLNIRDIGFEICRILFGDEIPLNELEAIVNSSINFEAPVVQIDERIFSLELWHGPSLAFKDFGARFMAALMSYFNKDEDKSLTILVATSGDTGGAVAFGFYDVPGIEVIILYPKGKVSLLQEKQLTTLGKNIHAVEVEGTFDDCQAMVKEAFLDNDLKAKYNLSSANSINIARLIPQTFYYFDAYRQIMHHQSEVVFSVPSGNFGNLTAGLLAKRMGLPVKKFIAATNVNNVVPTYLKSNVFRPMESISTISNAMDVGNPSNFTRMMAMYDSDHEWISNDVVGSFATDVQTKDEMKYVFQKDGYVTDPHGAVAHLALRKYLEQDQSSVGIFLETAHPAKFIDTVVDTLETDVAIPERLGLLATRNKVATLISPKYAAFKSFLMDRI